MLRVSFEEVSALASEVNRGSEELNQVVGTLTSTFNNSSSYWEGNAREQFSQAYQEWNGAWGKMHEALQEMQTLIQQWNEKARELDQSVHR